MEDTTRIQTLGRLAGSCLQVHQALRHRPVSTIARLSQEASHSLPTVSAAMGRLGEAGMVTESTEGEADFLKSSLRPYQPPEMVEVREAKKVVLCVFAVKRFLSKG